MVRLTTPSIFWAVWVVLFNRKLRNIVLVFVKPWRFLYLFLYLSEEGYFRDGEILIAKDFVEPTTFRDFIWSLTTGQWLKVETQPISRVENFEYGGGVAWTKFQAVGIGNARMPQITVGDSVSNLHKRFDWIAEQNRQTKSMSGVTEEAQRQLAIESEMERLRREQDSQ